MPTYLIETASGGRQWEGKFGINEDFQLQLQGVEKPAILTQKPGTPVPRGGDNIELTLEPHPRFDDKLKAKRPGQFGAGGARPEDPKRSARIQRMHSQDMALRTIAFAAEHQLVEQPTDGAGLMALIAKTADWFDKDAQAAGDRA